MQWLAVAANTGVTRTALQPAPSKNPTYGNKLLESSTPRPTAELSVPIASCGGGVSTTQPTRIVVPMNKNTVNANLDGFDLIVPPFS